MFPQARKEVAILLGLSKSSVEVIKINQTFWGKTFWGIVAEVCCRGLLLGRS